MSYLYRDGLHTKTHAQDPETEKFLTGPVEIQYRHVDDETMWIGMRVRGMTFSWFTVPEAKDVCRHILAEIERFEATPTSPEPPKKPPSRRKIGLDRR